MNERNPSAREAEPSLADLAESVSRKLVTAIVIAGGLIGLGLWSRPGPARYQVIAAEGWVYRINTDSGTVIGCLGTRCAIVVQHGQRLEGSLPTPPPQLAPPPRAAPAPASAPAAAPTPALAPPTAAPPSAPR